MPASKRQEVHAPDPTFRRGVDELNACRHVAARRLFAGVIASAGDDAPWAAQELIQSYLRRGQAEAAERRIRAAIADGSPLLDHALGYLYRRTGRARLARPCLERAALARPRLWAASNELGYVLCRAGEERRGLALLRAAERHFAATGNDWGRAGALVQQATHALLSFRLLDALRDFERATALRRATGDRFGLASIRSNVGIVLYYLADYRRAIEAYQEAIGIYQAIGERYFLGMALNGSGVCHDELAETHLASTAFRAALAIFRRVGDRDNAAGARSNLGCACRHRRDLPGAIRYYRAALESLGPGADAETRSVTGVNLAEALSLSGRPDEALVVLRATQADSVSARTRILLAREIARAELGRGDVERAIASARDALSRVRQIPGPQQRLITHWVPAEMILGRALLASGRRREALRTLRRCAGHLETLLLSGQRGAADRVGLLETYRSVHDAWLLALLAADDAPRRRPWRLAARLKARELRHAVVTSRRGGTANRRFDEAEAEVRRLIALPRLDPGQAGRLRELRRRAHGSGRGVDVGAPRTAEKSLASLLRAARAALIEYHVAAESSVAFLLLGDGRIESFELPVGERSLERAIDRLMAPLRDAGAVADPQRYLAAFDLAAAARLHRHLLEPLFRRLPSDLSRLIIVPDGPLHALPFELLRPAPRSGADSDPWRATDYLMERFAVSYSQSSLLLRRPRQRRPGVALLYGFSPPDGTVVHGGLGPRTVGPLAEARAELDAVAACLHSVIRLEDDAATADAFADAAPGCSMIHVAAHAMSDPLAPGLSGIVVAPGSSGAEADFLTGERLGRMRFVAELVTLSACDGGRGRLRAREGIFGLSRAFVEAGADAVLASLWPVDDRATRRLMTAFYSALQTGRDRATALALAKRALRASEGDDRWHRHPFFWAGFILVDHRPQRGAATSRPPAGEPDPSGT